MEIDGFLGAVLEPSSDGYETTRQIWNGDMQRRPAVIARCTGAADVLAAVCFGRERDLPVSVRGGGHAVAGHALCEGGLVIDLSPMTCGSTPWPDRSGPRAAVCGATSTTRHRPSGWR